MPCIRDAGKYVTIGFTFQFMGGVGFHFLDIGLVSMNISLSSVTDLLFDSFKVLVCSLVV